jgi:hypothetical protein
MENFKEDAFEKGRLFENYVERVLFPKRTYLLLDRTHSFKQNAYRYVESSKKPDFKFRSKTTSQEFYVEVKFRAKYDSNDQVTIMKPTQFTRFTELNKELPILVVIGVGGKPDNPDLISLIPFQELQYLNIYKSVINNHKIDKNNAYELKLRDENKRKASQQAIITPYETEDEGVDSKPNRNPIYIWSFVLIFLISYTLLSFTKLK